MRMSGESMIAGGVVALIGAGVLIGHIAYDAGWRDAYADGADTYNWVMSKMRKVGTCKWPAAFYAAAQCPGTMIYLEPEPYLARPASPARRDALREDVK